MTAAQIERLRQITKSLYHETVSLTEIADDAEDSKTEKQIERAIKQVEEGINTLTFLTDRK